MTTETALPERDPGEEAQNRELTAALARLENENLQLEKLLAQAEQRIAAQDRVLAGNAYEIQKLRDAHPAGKEKLREELEQAQEKLTAWKMRYAVLAWGADEARHLTDPHPPTCILCKHPIHLIAATEREEPGQQDLFAITVAREWIATKEKLAGAMTAVELVRNLQDRCADVVRLGGAAGSVGAVDDAVRALKKCPLPPQETP